MDRDVNFYFTKRLKLCFGCWPEPFYAFLSKSKASKHVKNKNTILNFSCPVFVLVIWHLQEQFCKLEVWSTRKNRKGNVKEPPIIDLAVLFTKRTHWFSQFHQRIPDFKTIAFKVPFGKISVHLVTRLSVKMQPSLWNMTVNLTIK